MSNDNTFGLLLGRLRTATGISQTRLAKLAGFDHSYLSRLESGDRHPTRETVLKLARCLSLMPGTVDDLMRAAGYLTDTNPVRDDLLALNTAMTQRVMPDWVRSHVESQVAGLLRLIELAAPATGDGEPAREEASNAA